MRKFDYREEWKALLTPEIVSYLSQIHEFKGEQTLFIESKADTLTQLVEIAKIQSTEASNKIEGIYTSDERLRALVKDTTRPKTRTVQRTLAELMETDEITKIGGGRYTKYTWNNK